jgi:hypothetical protein
MTDPQRDRSIFVAMDVLLYLLHSILIQENFDKRGGEKKQITFPLRHFFPLKVVKKHGNVKSNSMENYPA